MCRKWKNRWKALSGQNQLTPKHTLSNVSWDGASLSIMSARWPNSDDLVSSSITWAAPFLSPGCYSAEVILICKLPYSSHIYFLYPLYNLYIKWIWIIFKNRILLQKHWPSSLLYQILFLTHQQALKSLQIKGKLFIIILIIVILHGIYVLTDTAILLLVCG